MVDVNLRGQSETMALRETILQLSNAINNLKFATQQMGTNAQMDPVLANLKSQYGDNTTKMEMEYNRIRTEMMSAMSAPYMQQMQNTLMQIQQTQAASMYIQQQQQTLGQVQLPPATAEMMPFYAQSAAQLRQQYTPAFETLGYNPGYMNSYFNRYSMPFNQNIFNRGISDMLFRGETPGNVPANTPLLMQAADYNYQSRLAGDIAAGRARPADFREYYDFQQKMHESTQKAALNYTMATGLGVRGGFIEKAEMEQGYTPAINNLADTLGVTFDDAIAVVKKMKDLKAITADIGSGRATDISIGVENVIKTLGAVSKLVGSSDLQQLIAASEQISRFGGGNFRSGMGNIAAGLGIDQKYLNATTLQSNMQYLDPSTNPYLQAFGMNRSGVGMGAFIGRAASELGSYGSGSVFERLGGAEGTSQLLGGLLTGNQMMPAFLAAARGKGNFIAGAGSLSSDIMANPVGFYMGLDDMRSELQGKYSGGRAMGLLDAQIDNLVRNTGLSRDEAILALSGGDRNKALALREYQRAGAGVQEELRRKYEFSSMFGGSIGGSQYIEEYGGRYETGWGVKLGFTTAEKQAEAMARSASESSWLTRWGEEAFSDIDNSFPMQFLGASTIKKKYSGAGQNRGLTNTDPRVNVNADYNPFTSGFFDARGRRMVSTGRSSGGRATLNEGGLASANVTSALVNALTGTETAQKRIADMLTSIVSTGTRPALGHVKDIMHSAINEYQTLSGMSSAAAYQLHDFVNKADLNTIAKNILPSLPEDSPIYNFIQAAMGMTTDLSRLTRDDTSLMRLATANVMRQAGVSGETLQGMNLFEEKGFLRKASEFVGKAEPWLDAASLGLALAPIPGSGILAGAAFTTAMVGKPVLKGLATAVEWTETVSTNSVNALFMEKLSAFAKDENMAGITKEAVLLLGIINKFWSRNVGQFVMYDLETSMGQFLIELISSYSEYHIRVAKTKTAGQKDKDKSTVTLTSPDLSALTESQVKRFAESFSSPESAAKVISIIYNTINKPQSEIGRKIRASNPGELAGLKADIMEASKKASDRDLIGNAFGLSNWDTLSEGLETIVNTSAEAASNMVLTATNISRAAVNEQDFNNLKTDVMRALTAKDSKAASSGESALEKIRTYATGAGKDLGLSESEMTALKDFDPAMADQIREIQGSTKTVKEKKIAVSRMLNALESSQRTVRESSQAQAMQSFSFLTQLADQIMKSKDPGAQAIKDLLSGRS